jgi:hypothetical protein
VPFRYSTSDHGGYSGAEIGMVKGGKIVLTGGPLTTTPATGSPITPFKWLPPPNSTETQAPPPANGIPTS